jgi:hypothetical protein
MPRLRRRLLEPYKSAVCSGLTRSCHLDVSHVAATPVGLSIGSSIHQRVVAVGRASTNAYSARCIVRGDPAIKQNYAMSDEPLSEA